MNTQAQIKAEIYNALKADTTLPDAIYWTSQANMTTFPCLVYELIAGGADYVFSTSTKNSENIAIQIDIYTDAGAMASMDTIKAQLHTVMEGINYQNIDNGQEFGDEETGKVVRPTRWVRVDV